ncbi:MAG: ABC transporter ATP-binding protein [Burkholderia sp.]|jgi:putative spermidine/putrescine transport system ATP-binding protein|uniref:Spermidine/putrescine import ATP-binding protein PotA n=3 Tax=Pseudomonadota TaxID=1224 RepID=A0A833UZJ8_BURL3|nr:MULTISPECIES: ABC transporter ATP-binding protein [Burkholderia]KAF1035252.1 MAG: Spermidine/putrescine import ATP-binding protein PotA [Burkholderia lata]MCA3778133.1 ABC transporter ATP-binding protein [Burkholderia sp.]MCA3789864.1 ABC transporter ATP-binding protein [Burkholderia sp.]MCA3795957.1 ABC transporter ATP-binding protein [Burkholderia sp.]MCA3799241.1 ABC transporter ATP-binding protein [Burkholderia sp.]
MSTIVSFKNVQKTYDGETLVVKNLNLEIEQGEFLTMLGPSGSGKTTCLMMLAGFETATHGEILLQGKPINRIPPERRNIGMVFQSYALFPHKSVAENLAFPLKVRKVSKSDIDTKVMRALRMVNMEKFANRMPAQLSGGQQQRIAVARALVFEPALVLMDEPLGALDKQLREQMQYEIKQIHEQSGLTVVYVTHDQGEAMTMSDRIAVFNNGIIQQLASPSELYEKPANAFVARFIGESNELNGVVSSLDHPRCVVRLDGGHAIHASANGGIQLSGNTSVSLRPERIAVGEQARTCDNVFSAGVKDLIYYGDHLRIVMQVCGRGDFVVKLPNDGAARNLRIGDSVDIGWMADACRAL